MFDIIICLGSVNFGSTDKIFTELEHIVSIASSNGKMYFRVNPGLSHTPPESKWITFYPWTPTFIMNSAEFLDVDVLELRNDSNGRMYFVWRKT